MVDGSETMSKCYSEGDVSITSIDAQVISAGGFIGDSFGEGATYSGGYLPPWFKILNCYSWGDVTYTGDYVYVSGGNANSFGGFIASSYTTDVENSYSSGNVTINGSFNATAWLSCGGFIGSLLTGDLKNVYSVGVVTATATNLGGIGGFVGMFDSYDLSELENCSWFTGAFSIPIGRFAREWSPSSSYYYGAGSSGVVYDGIIYALLATNINQQPDISPTYWEVVCPVFTTLTDGSVGTDEPDNTLFYHKEHAVYAQI
jgi:hypothetical protein